MKYFKRASLVLFAFLIQSVCLAQIRSMGFTQKTPALLNVMDLVYYPKLQIINDTLFVCSVSGIYQKDLLRDSKWELYAFKDAPVIEFVRNGRELIANALSTTNGRDSLLLISRDGGKSYKDYTSPVFWEYKNNHLYRISQNPQNPSSLITAVARYGLYRSKDFGAKWENFFPYSLGIHIAFADFHPLDTATLFFSGEDDAFSGRIFKSSDGGNTWGEYIVPGGDNCVHQIDFHPSDPNMLIWGGEGKIGKSTDKGETWEVADLYDTGMYFYKVLFDKENPGILYASGAHGAYRGDDQDTIWVYRSTDMGESWHLAYKEWLGANGGEMIDMVKYKDKLIFYTRELGILELDVKNTPVLSNQYTILTKSDLTVYPDPAGKTLHFETDKIIKRVDMINSTGERVQQFLLQGKERSVDVSKLSSGIYLAVFYSEQQIITRKVLIR